MLTCPGCGKEYPMLYTAVVGEDVCGEWPGPAEGLPCGNAQWAPPIRRLRICSLPRMAGRSLAGRLSGA